MWNILVYYELLESGLNDFIRFQDSKKSWFSIVCFYEKIVEISVENIGFIILLVFGDQ